MSTSSKSKMKIMPKQRLTINSPEIKATINSNFSSTARESLSMNLRINLLFMGIFRPRRNIRSIVAMS